MQKNEIGSLSSTTHKSSSQWITDSGMRPGAKHPRCKSPCGNLRKHSHRNWHTHGQKSTHHRLVSETACGPRFLNHKTMVKEGNIREHSIFENKRRKYKRTLNQSPIVESPRWKKLDYPFVTSTESCFHKRVPFLLYAQQTRCPEHFQGPIKYACGEDRVWYYEHSREISTAIFSNLHWTMFNLLFSFQPQLWKHPNDQ